MPQHLPGSDLYFLLWDVARLWRQSFERAVGASGLELTAGEVRTLSNVAHYRGSRQTALAERMGIEPMTLSGFLEPLERQGYVSRAVDPTDRRAKVIEATPAASEVFDRLRQPLGDIFDRVTTSLDPISVEALEAVLLAMRDALASEAAAAAPAPAEAQPALSRVA
jgi:MarR family transcriptional regulator, transcriptional regulator for hemolysin